MTQTPVPATGEERRQAAARASKEAGGSESKTLDALHTEHGDTAIADTVVAKISGIAAREVPGVYAMGNAARRAIGNLTQRIPGGSQPSVAGGVSVEKGERETVIDISIVIEYGVAIVSVSDQIRANVISAVEHGTGLDVVAVNVNVTDVHLPEDDSQADTSLDTELR